jgi:hypothetical protein
MDIIYVNNFTSLIKTIDIQLVARYTVNNNETKGAYYEFDAKH